MRKKTRFQSINIIIIIKYGYHEHINCTYNDKFSLNSMDAALLENSNNIQYRISTFAAIAAFLVKLSVN